MPIFSAQEAYLALRRRFFLQSAACNGVGITGMQWASLALAQKTTKEEIKSNSQAALVRIKRPWFVTVQDVLVASSATLAVAPDPFSIQENRPLQISRATHWARQILRMVVKYQQNPLRAARAMAHVHVAMHDAWLHGFHLSQDAISGELAAHRAASLVIEHFYPNETPGQFEVQYAWISTKLAVSELTKEFASSLGAQVASAVINRSLRDGAGQVWPLKNRPPDFAGRWQATYPLYAVNPTEGFAGEWRPWVKPDAKRYQPPTAIQPGSPIHAEETREVWRISKELSTQQKHSAERWNLESGSVTPGGIWIQQAIDQLLITAGKSESLNAGFENSLHVLATLSVAIQDAFIACWKIKFRDWSERPITTIRRDLDKDFAPVLVTPGFPGYVSGHATVSAAAAHVLSGFWPARAAAFADMAREAAMSRLWGGIHFRSDNKEGLLLGDAVGQEVWASRQEPTK